MVDYPGHAKYHFCVQRPRLRYKRLLGDFGRPVALLWRLFPWSGVRSELASGEFLIAGRCASEHPTDPRYHGLETLTCRWLILPRSKTRERGNG